MLLRLTFAATLLGTAAFAQEDPLPSWNDGPTKQALLDFVSAATTEGGPDWIAPGDRIATFDNDGTLWSEQPMYFQGMFINDRIKALAADNPDWASTMPFKAVLDGDMAALGAAGEKGLVELLGATHAGMTNEEFEAIVKDWIATARHPRYNDKDGPPRFDREPGVFFVDGKEGKPVGILRHIGREPVIAFGNSDCDYQMLEYVTAGDGPDLGLIVHHTDATREWAYDRESHIGTLARSWAPANHRAVPNKTVAYVVKCCITSFK